jgi:hypothetical protein
MYTEMNTRFDKLEYTQLALENKLDDTRKVLFDFYTQNTEQINRIEQTIEEISQKIEIHDVEIKVIKGGRY